MNNPQISILISSKEQCILKNNKIINNLILFINQNLNNVQIIISISKECIKIKNEILSNYSFMTEKVEFKIINNRNLLFNLFNLINILKGKFIVILDKYINIEKDELETFYNYTKGKIDNIFKFITKNGNSIFFIRSKILKDIIDTHLYFNTFIDLINYIISLPNPQISYISIALCPDNFYTPLAYVAMSSILYSKNIYTYISFYIITPNNFNDQNADFIRSLYKEYDYFNITFIKMDNRYDNSFISGYISSQTYYRISLGELLPNLNKIIYLDTDVIVFKDLTNLYNLNFNGKMILGQMAKAKQKPKKGFYRINAGILLLNLKEMREQQMEKKLLKVLKKGYKSDLHDQTLINNYYGKKLGLFPPEYNQRPFKNFQDMIIFNQMTGKIYDNDYFYFTNKYPTIIHYLGFHNKPYNNDINNKVKEDWWFFARKSKYFFKKTNNLTEIFNFMKNNN